MATDTTTRPELDLPGILDHLNAEAKAMSRRGHTGTDTVEYAIQHDRINAVLTAWQDAQG